MNSCRFNRRIRNLVLFIVVTMSTILVIRTTIYKQEYKDMHHLSKMNNNQPVTGQHYQDNKTERCNQCFLNSDVQDIDENQLQDKVTSFEHINVQRNNTPLLSSRKNVLQRNKTQPVIVVILAYMHTGSSYTARIIQQHPDTFYEFEPLRSLQERSRRNLPIYFLNGTQRRVSGEIIAPDIGSETVRNTITCNHHKLDLATLSTSYRGLISSDNRDTADFFKCQKKTRNNKTTIYGTGRNSATNHFKMGASPSSRNEKFNSLSQNNRASKFIYRHQRPVEQKTRNYKRTSNRHSLKNTNIKHKHVLKELPLSVYNQSIKSCLPRLVSKCRNATIRVTKYIRMTMEMVENLLPNYKNVRVIHLVRDPRAMMDSQLRKNDMNVKLLPLFVRRTRYMCTRMKTDLDISKRLKTSYPNQIYTLRYEDLAYDPIKIGMELFKFIGVPFTLNDKQYIISTSLNQERDSKYRAVVWRNHIAQKHLQIVDKYCQNLYNELNYRRFTSVIGVRNLTMPAYFVAGTNTSDL